MIAIICSKSSVPAKMAEELKSSYSKGILPSVIKRIKRFLYQQRPYQAIYRVFIKFVLEQYKNKSKKIYVIFDHTTCDDRFLILQFSFMIVGRTLPIWFKVFDYKDKKNQKYEHLKEGLDAVYELLGEYDFKVIVLADRAFRNVKLFKYIVKQLKWNFAIRVVGNTLVDIPGNKRIEKLQDIKIKPGQIKKFKNVKLTEAEYICNLVVSKIKEKPGKYEDTTWYIVTNLEPTEAKKAYEKRFRIEEMFKDLKSNGFDLEGTWTNNLTYFTNLYMCICMAYTWMISLGSICSKNKHNKEIGAVKRTRKNVIVRIYSLFSTGIKWFKSCYNNEERKKLYYSFAIYVS